MQRNDVASMSVLYFDVMYPLTKREVHSHAMKEIISQTDPYLEICISQFG